MVENYKEKQLQELLSVPVHQRLLVAVSLRFWSLLLYEQLV